MTRHRLSPDERARRQDAQLYDIHFKIIELAKEARRADRWNASHVVRASLELYGETYLGQDLKLDELLDAEERIKAFEQAHDGKPPSQIKAEKAAEYEKLRGIEFAEEQKREEAKLARERLAYSYLKKKDLGASSTLDWFANWHKEMVELGWRGAPFEVMHKLVEKGDREGWPT